MPSTYPLTADRLWRHADRAFVVACNAGALALLVAAWVAVRDKGSLSGQASWIAAAIAGLALGAAGDAWFLLVAKSTVAARIAVLLRPGPGPGDGSAAVAGPLRTPEGHLGGRTGAAGPTAGWARVNCDRLVAIAAGLAGAAALLGGWLGLSGVLVDHDQVPWILACSFTGLWLLGVAGTAWLAAVLRDQWSVLGRIAGRLGELGVASVADLPDPGPRRQLRGTYGIPSLL